MRQTDSADRRENVCTVETTASKPFTQAGMLLYTWKIKLYWPLERPHMAT
jgi:hypothetical protein